MNTQVIPDTYGERRGGLSVIFTNTQKHWCPVSSCQVKGHKNRVTEGMPRGFTGLGGPWSRMLLPPLQIGKVAQWTAPEGDHALPAQRRVGAYTTMHWSATLTCNCRELTRFLIWREQLRCIKSEVSMSGSVALFGPHVLSWCLLDYKSDCIKCIIVVLNCGM